MSLILTPLFPYHILVGTLYSISAHPLAISNNSQAENLSCYFQICTIDVHSQEFAHQINHYDVLVVLVYNTH